MILMLLMSQSDKMVHGTCMISHLLQPHSFLAFSHLLALYYYCAVCTKEVGGGWGGG